MKKENLEVKDFFNLGVAVNDKGEVLMIRRVKKEVGKNGSVLTWAFPGGKQGLKERERQCEKRDICRNQL